MVRLGLRVRDEEDRAEPQEEGAAQHDVDDSGDLEALRQHHYPDRRPQEAEEDHAHQAVAVGDQTPRRIHLEGVTVRPMPAMPAASAVVTTSHFPYVLRRVVTASRVRWCSEAVKVFCCVCTVCYMV